MPGKGILRGIAIATKLTEDASDIVSIERVEVDNGFFPSLNMNFVAGTAFNENMNDMPPIILNVSAVKALGLGSPQEAVGQVIYEFGRAKRKVVGVIEDYHHESLNREKEAMYFVRNEAISTYYVVRLSLDNTQTVIAGIEGLFESTFDRVYTSTTSNISS